MSYLGWALAMFLTRGLEMTTMTATPEQRAQTIAAIVAECEAQGLTLKTQQAYVLATVEHETAGTWLPVREAYWHDDAWRKRNFRYYPFYGRGYVQLTWRRNYEVYSKLIGVDLVAAPDLAMEPSAATFILVHGFKNGTFTGKKIEDYINEERRDFVRARRCVNGNDRARRIATLADKWLIQLSGTGG